MRLSQDSTFISTVLVLKENKVKESKEDLKENKKQIDHSNSSSIIDIITSDLNDTLSDDIIECNSLIDFESEDITEINNYKNNNNLLFTLLKNVFNIHSFRTNQEQIIRSILLNKNVYVVMPTGGGKSLNYFLSGIIRCSKNTILNHITLIISPLLSLIHDQVIQLLDLNILSLFITSTITHKEKEMIKEIIKHGLRIKNKTHFLKFIFTTPETFNTSHFLKEILKNTQLTLIVDEAHCISNWGNDFRPEYLRIRESVGEYRMVNCVGLTGSAYGRIEDDIFECLYKGDLEGNKVDCTIDYDLKGGKYYLEGNTIDLEGNQVEYDLEGNYLRSDSLEGNTIEKDLKGNYLRSDFLEGNTIEKGLKGNKVDYDLKGNKVDCDSLKGNTIHSTLKGNKVDYNSTGNTIHSTTHYLKPYYNTLIFKSPFNRPNLKYLLIKKDKNTLKNILSFINTYYPQSSGIIYCHSKKQSESVCHFLKKNNILSDYYHAGLTPKRRNTIQTLFLNNTLKVIVATIAFGMGINHKSVRFVIHFDNPRSIVNYYQESGRGGRDGLVCYCLLFFNVNDKYCEEEVIVYGVGRGCRRRRLMGVFGERVGGCDGCDVCDEGMRRIKERFEGRSERDCKEKGYKGDHKKDCIKNHIKNSIISFLKSITLKDKLTLTKCKTLLKNKKLKNVSLEQIEEYLIEALADGIVRLESVRNRMGFGCRYLVGRGEG